MNHHLHLVFNAIPSSLTLQLLSLVVLAVGVVGLSRRIRGTCARTISLSLVLLTLSNPSVIREQQEPLKDIVVVAIDDSASMQSGHRKQQVTKALSSLMEKLASFADLDVQTVTVSGRDETDLFRAIDQKLVNVPHDRLAGIIALTDGEIHDKPASLYDVPFHAFLVGHRDEVDRRLIVREAPAYGIVGKTVSVKIKVDDQPQPQSETALVSFRKDGSAAQTFSVPVGKDVTLDMPIDHTGINMGVFSTDMLPQEVTGLNNTVAVHVNGIRDRLRVLLVSGQPHMGERTWRNFLKADPAVDLIHFTILRSPTKQDGVPNSELALIAFPVHELFEVKLKSFDLVILDRFSNQSLVPDNYLSNIARYVETGGALLVSNATDDGTISGGTSPLTSILPVVPTGQILTGEFVPDLTPSGLRHPVTSALIKQIPQQQWGPWYRQIAARASKGEVLMSGLNHQPLLVLDHVGQGRVAQFLSDEFWLWAHQGNGPQAELLRRVAHWLVQEPELDETALRAHAEETEHGWNVIVTQRSLHGQSEEGTVIDPQGQSVPLHLEAGAEPGVLQAIVPVEASGLYQVNNNDQKVWVMAGVDDVPEYGDMRATSTVLEPIVKATGGGLFWLERDEDHLGGIQIRRQASGSAQQGWNWVGLRQNGLTRVTGSKAFPLLSPWLLVVGLLSMCMLAWWREGRD